MYWLPDTDTHRQTQADPRVKGKICTKKGVSSLGPVLARGAPEPRCRRRQLMYWHYDVAEYSRDRARAAVLPLPHERTAVHLYLIEAGRSRKTFEGEHNLKDIS